MASRPKVILFDIGGVLVLSPLQGILDHERAQGLPIGYINATISSTAPGGAWQRLERGELALDRAFFSQFRAELEEPRRWARFWREQIWAETDARKRRERVPKRYLATREGEVPPVPGIDAESMFWEMMRLSRRLDPWVFPALERLRASGEFVVAALSNTIIFPEGVRDERGLPFESGVLPPASSLSDARGQGEGGDGKMEVRTLFDAFVSSAHIGMRKPEPRIYEYTLQEIRRVAREKGMGEVEAKDVLFLDDIGGNLREARRQGMGTIKVGLGRSREAVEELERRVGMRLVDERGRL